MFFPRLESWFAVQVVPQHEKQVASMLEYKGYELFLPTYLSKRYWSDRVKVLERPLFPGYVFCRLREMSLGSVCMTPGVVRILGAGPNSTSIPDAEIEAIARAVRSGLDICPFIPYARVGQHVRVKQGPLAGIVGRLIQIKNRTRLVLAVEVAFKAITVDIDAAEVTPLEFA
jgi:transcription antitermination factor NusG